MLLDPGHLGLQDTRGRAAPGGRVALATSCNAGPIRFSTRHWPERDRVAVWREVLGKKIIRVDFEPSADRPFSAEASLRVLPGLRIVTADVSHYRLARTRELIADGNNELRFTVSRGGTECLTQRGRSIALAESEATLVSCAEPCSAVRQSIGRNLGLHIPYSTLAAMVPNVEDVLLRPIPRDTPALRLLLSYVDAIQCEAALATPELRLSVVSHVHDLVALATGASRDAAALAEGRGARAARLHEIKRDIIENLGRGDLSMRSIAQSHRLQPRYIQRMFEQEGTTFSEYLTHQRLSRSHRMLADPRQIERTIGAIALACGFSEQSYFNRCFKKLYGLAPSEVRARARQDHEQDHGFASA
jgi:AraC-like DNA-binding protein